MAGKIPMNTRKKLRRHRAEVQAEYEERFPRKKTKRKAMADPPVDPKRAWS